MRWSRIIGAGTAAVMLVFVLSVFPGAYAKKAETEIPTTGRTSPQLASFDHLMMSMLQKNKDVPGVSLAVARFGRTIYARGFGYADKEKKDLVQPDALFRIASVTKPLTAVAILQLVEHGKLKLHDHVFDVLHLKEPDDPKVKFDDRWKKITIEQLLHHTGGWDRDKKGGFDPMFHSPAIVKELKVPSPANQEAIIHYMLRRPLDFDPGKKYVYSNFGYCLLGRVIEKVSGQHYETYVRKEVLGPLGVTSMKLGKTLPEHRAKGEVRYYSAGQGKALFGPQAGKEVPWPYGCWSLEAMDSHGGWIASAEDLVRFAAAFDHPAQCKVLKEKSIHEMFARPEGAAGHKPDGKPRDSYYGCGWEVRPINGGEQHNTWHSGSLDGTSTLLVRRFDGMTWAVLFNSREGVKKGKERQEPADEIDGLLHEAADAYLKKVK